MNLLRRILSRRRLERDLGDEIAQHLDERVDAIVADGVSRREATLQARREFGNVTLIEERGREIWRWGLVEDLWTDLRHAVRQLRHTPSFTAAAVLTLALGIGANTAVFSVVRGVLLQPLPFPHADRLVSIESREIRGGSHPARVSYPTFFDFRRSAVLPQLVSYRDTDFTLTGRGAAAHLHGQVVSWDLFQLLQVEPALGRAFTVTDERAGARVVILSHALWTTRFGADPTLPGGAISLDGRPYTVLGIAPRGFAFPIDGAATEIWTTLAVDAASATAQPVTEQRGARILSVVGRLPPEMSLTDAHARLDAVAAGLARQYPDENGNQPGTYVRPLLEWMLGPARQGILVLWGAVGFVLLIACANLANMLLARSVDRERELGVRLAIGGSRARVLRHLLTEHLVLTMLGCGAGLLLAAATLRGLVPLVADRLPRIDGVAIDPSVIAFAAGLAVATSLLCSVPAALRLGRVDLGSALRSQPRGGTDTHDRLRGTLVVAQIAISLTLLAAASLLGSAFVRMMTRDPGFRMQHLVGAGVTLPTARLQNDGHVPFFDQLLERLRAVPGVTAAGAGTPLPLAGDEMQMAFDIELHPAPPNARPSADMAIVVPGYFSTIGTLLLEGRDFVADDDIGHPGVVIVNKAFADHFFPGQRLLGRRIESGATSRDEVRQNGRRWREIVGVVGNARQSPLVDHDTPIYYVPFRQMTWAQPHLLVRTASDAGTLEPELRRIVASLDRDAAVHDVATLETMLTRTVAGPRFLTLVMASFAGMAVVLATVGLYGILSYSVLRRTREIGVRIALGASRSRVVRMVLRRAMTLVAAGLAIGLLGAIAVTRVIGGLVPVSGAGTSAVVALAALVLVGGACVAAVIPARRAASIDSSHALRVE